MKDWWSMPLSDLTEEQGAHLIGLCKRLSGYCWFRNNINGAQIGLKGSYYSEALKAVSGYAEIVKRLNEIIKDRENEKATKANG